MPKPLLKILARFDINQKSDQPLEGRAYLSSYGAHAWDPSGMIIDHTPDLVYAVTTLREVIASKELEEARKKEYTHAVAIMWGEPRQGGEANQMIDLLLWKFNSWEENGEIQTLPLRNGAIINPAKDGSLPVTCEGGWDLIREEELYRRMSDPISFRMWAPTIPDLILPGHEHDFSNPEGRRKLQGILKKKTYSLA